MSSSWGPGRAASPSPAWRYTAAHIRRLLSDPLVLVVAIVVFLLWCAVQALAGEPGLPADTSIAPPVYVVEGPVSP